MTRQGATEMHFQLYRSTTYRGRRWRWRLRAGNGEIIASGEDYHNRADAEHAIGLIKHASAAPIMVLGEGWL